MVRIQGGTSWWNELPGRAHEGFILVEFASAEGRRGWERAHKRLILMGFASPGRGVGAHERHIPVEFASAGGRGGGKKVHPGGNHPWGGEGKGERGHMMGHILMEFAFPGGKAPERHILVEFASAGQRGRRVT